MSKPNSQTDTLQLFKDLMRVYSTGTREEADAEAEAIYQIYLNRDAAQRDLEDQANPGSGSTSGLVEVPLSASDEEFLRSYYACDERGKSIIKQTLSYLADTHLVYLRRQMLAAGMTRQADGTWKDPA